MTEQQLHLALNSGRLSKVQISGLVETLELHPELTGKLLQEVFEQDSKDTFNASWVFDHLMRKRLVYLLPHLDSFTHGLSKLRDESGIRPMAHVCEMLCEAYFKKKDEAFLMHMTQTHLETMMTVCFDWFIGPHKVAAKVFAMSSLYYLGTRFDWVHPELRMILEETISNGTAGYKNRAKKTLDKLAQLGH
ncbi:adenylosuccinate lyase [Flagellimonas myxillae]|uniref:adenylosuccinate lyase n=1 Tax=Flagellimonas myxillae TaxID=2942214 RepID=UPI00201F5154|nr:adenylosuccinate lyase [Muricauda myxillae]MCL6265598.1 adenylosuccinate lyase [Muricauda myxillae]